MNQQELAQRYALEHVQQSILFAMHGFFEEKLLQQKKETK